MKEKGIDYKYSLMAFFLMIAFFIWVTSYLSPCILDFQIVAKIIVLYCKNF